MYFTNEEKTIIYKIAVKEIYTLNDFFEDNYPDRNLCVTESSYSPDVKGWENTGKLMNLLMSQGTEGYEFKNDYLDLMIRFIKIWEYLDNNHYVVNKSINHDKIKKNFKNFIIKSSISNEMTVDYEIYCTKEMVVIQSDLQDFINDGFKTKDELRIEEEIKARNEALKDAKKSFWISFILAMVSIAVSVIPFFKDDKVIIKNQINTQQLEIQLKQTNQELKDIKTKFEELENQIQKPIKN